MRGWKSALAVLATALIVAPLSAADKPLNSGEKAPTFTLKDQYGKEQSLTGLLKENRVAVVFHRSADW